jgi:hypothetical protein
VGRIDFFRLVSVVYLIRCLTMCLTSLPGPAPHCDGVGDSPPAGFRDVVTRLGPLYGDYKTCGDLLFSGHAASLAVMALLALRQLRGAPRLWAYQVFAGEDEKGSKAVMHLASARDMLSYHNSSLLLFRGSKSQAL